MSISTVETSLPLLTTKLYIPPRRPNLLARSRLTARLDEAVRLRHRLILVSAKAGAGKTTLVSEWLHQQDQLATWLSLDDNDNDPLRFLNYLIAALGQLGIEINRVGSGQFGTPSVPPGETVVAELINEIASSSLSFLLVLDDYHFIQNEWVHQAVGFLAEHQPPHMQLVLITRVDPPLPLARLRGRGQVTEIRDHDLRFTLEEATRFLNELMALELPPEAVSTLEWRTEGWIAGLQMAAISMQGRKQAGHLGTFIDAFGGTNRYILDYLLEEVLNQQTPAIQSFLLETSILERMCADLCDAVRFGEARAHSGSAQDSAPRDQAITRDSQAILAQLDRANLFVTSLDDERRWYRYHHLFADLLQSALRQHTSEEGVRQLHRRASRWYEEKGLLADAVRHFLAAGDLERAADLIDWTGWTMLARGEMRALLGWLDALPQDVVDSQAHLTVLRAWALALTGQWDGVEQSLRQADDRHVPGELDALHAYLASVRGDVPRTMELCSQALTRLPEEKWFSRSIVALSQGIAHFASGEPVAASQALRAAIELGRPAGPTYMSLAAMMTLGHVQEMGGSLHQAVQTFRGALELPATQGVRPVPVAGLAHVGLAQVLYEWNDLDAALGHALQGIELTRSGGFASYLLAGYARLFEVYQARGALLDASHALDTAQRLAGRRDFAYMTAVLAKLRVRLWLAQGNLAAASQWLREYDLSPSDEANLAREVEHLAVVRVLLALGQPAEALPLLDRLLERAEKAGRMRSLIEILALQALALRARGDADRALSALERALALAQPEGYVRTFVDEGEALARLLHRALMRGIAPGYVSELLAASGESAQPGAPVAQALVEVLTEREMEVLRLIAAGLSNREIARELVVAVSTVKSHINHIYDKLDVKNRTQAIARAQTLGLL